MACCLMVPERMSNSHQRDSVAYTSEQFRKKFPATILQNESENYTLKLQPRLPVAPFTNMV